MNEGKRIHDEMHAGMGNFAMSMGPGGFPALVVVASVIIGGLAFMDFVSRKFAHQMFLTKGAIASWFGAASGYEDACIFGGVYLALPLFVLPYAALAFRAWRRERAGRPTLMSFRVTVSVLGAFLLAAGWSANVPAQTWLAIRIPEGAISQQAACMAEVPLMMKGVQRVGRTLADCEKYYDDTTMDKTCLVAIRHIRPLKYPYIGCDASARRLTGRADWPVDRTPPSWMVKERRVGPDPTASSAPQTPVATPEQMRAALKAKGIEPLAN